MVRVEDDGDAVEGSDGADEVGGRDGTADGGLLLVVGDALSGKVSGTTLGDLEDDGRLGVAGGLEGGVGGGGGGDVESGDGKVVLTSVVEDLVDVLSGNDAGLVQGKKRTSENCVSLRGRRFAAIAIICKLRTGTMSRTPIVVV